MQKSQKSATKSVTQGRGDLVFICETAVAHLEFFDIGFELIIVLGVDGIDASKDVGDNFLKTRNWSLIFLSSGKDRITDARFLKRFYACDDIADFAGFQRRKREVFRLETADFEDIDDGISTHECDLVTALDLTGEELDIDHDTTIRVVLGVKN